mgnify:CR=1 FL=1
MAFPSKIILGVTGSISAYKATQIIRLLTKRKAEVQTVLSKGGSQFITPLSLATLSNHEVLTDFHNPSTGLWHNHVHLGSWADVILIAPASANCIAHLANGLCNNLLHAIYLSAKCPVYVAPAMDHDMWHHPSVQRNIDLLIKDGIQIIPPESGELASGIIGDGRLAEPAHIIEFLEAKFLGA